LLWPRACGFQTRGRAWSLPLMVMVSTALPAGTLHYKPCTGPSHPSVTLNVPPHPLPGLCVRNVAADGNCMFRAVSVALRADEDSHLELRELAVNTIIASKDLHPFVEGNQHDPGGRWVCTGGGGGGGKGVFGPHFGSASSSR
jgi:hypothetical protein